MDNICKILKKEDFIISNWSGGTTTQLFIYPEKSTISKMDFRFRLSIATIDLEESPFSKLENIHRFITPLDGKLKLTHDNQDFTTLKPFKIYEFDGNWDTTSYGRVKDFNLMLGQGIKGFLSSYFVKAHSPLVIETGTGFNFIFSPFKELEVMVGNKEFKPFSKPTSPYSQSLFQLFAGCLCNRGRLSTCSDFTLIFSTQKRDLKFFRINFRFFSHSGNAASMYICKLKLIQYDQEDTFVFQPISHFTFSFGARNQKE